jgi:branched-chain amino acid transport system ATP-binding protein
VTSLVIDRLYKNFGGLQALHDLSLEIQPGERRAILGPNGAGKTTLFHLIGGQLSPSAGRIFLCGREVTHLPPFRRAALGLARTFQITTLFPNLTVRENMLLAVQALDAVKFVLYRPLTSYQHILSQARSLLEQWALWEKRHALVRQLSYGEQRQLEILLALAPMPRVLLLDEPTAGLSAAETQQVVAMIQHLDPSITVLLIEHDMDVAFQVAQHITVLHQGRLLADGEPSAIRQDPTVAEIYLGGTVRSQRDAGGA